MSNCTVVPCAEATSCGMVGGCVMQRFRRSTYVPRSAREADGVREDARALAGAKPARTNRDPAVITRRRKALEMMTKRPHSHSWIDPEDPPIQRAPYSPVIGPQRREMKMDRTYCCRECGATVTPRKTDL